MLDIRLNSPLPADIDRMDPDKRYRLQARSDKEMRQSSRFDSPESIDNWRHTRMLELARPAYRLGGTWLTVGDGRYGSDAAFLIKNGIEAIASSITDDNLQEAAARGYIHDYRAENAEALSLPDQSVDWVMCKESYHHFPRPPVALYEMLRVARQGVVLIEPIDNAKLLDGLKRLAKRILRGDKQTKWVFESSGNFLYRTSPRELEKLLLAMGGDTLAYKGFNDAYLPSLSGYSADTWNKGALLTKAAVVVQNMFARVGLLGYGLACFVIPKRADEALLGSLRESGFKIERLPCNPYSS